MKTKISAPLALAEPSEAAVRDYAYHLYEQSGCLPGRDVENWQEATVCLKTNVPSHWSGTPLHWRTEAPVEKGSITVSAKAPRVSRKTTRT